MALFWETVNHILPVFLLIFLGIFLNSLKFFSPVTKDEIVKLVYYVGTPTLLFHTVAKADLYQNFEPELVIFFLCAIVSYVLLLILICSFIRDPKKKGAVVQIGFRSNFAIVGMPLAMNLMAESGVLMTAISLAFVTICYNVTAVILLSYYGNKEQRFSSLMIGVIKNPLIVGTLLGLFFSLCRIPLPSMLDNSLQMAGNIASSMGLLAIGASITVKGFQKNAFYIFFALFLRNILAPLLFIGTAILLGFRNDALIITAILSATPAAVNCFVMAKKLGVDPDISAYGVSFSSLLSIVSILCSVYLLKFFSLS